MLRVSAVETDQSVVSVVCHYVQSYVARLRSLPGATYDRINRRWLVPSIYLDDLERLFKGELVYVTPRHVLRQEPPPRLPYYDDITLEEIPDLACPLYAFQHFGACFLAQRARQYGFAFLCDTTGVGKSPQALAAIRLLNPERVLIVTPASVRHQWVADTIPKFLGNVDVTEVCGGPAERQELYGRSFITVVNYEALLRDEDAILRQRYDLLVFDEAQRLKARQGKTHRVAARLAGRPWVRARLFLTATPLMNELEELYALFKIADPSILGKFADFKARYLLYDYSKGYPKLVGYRNLDALAELVAPFILRRTADLPEVAGQLPKLVTQNYYVDPTPVQRELHKRISATYSDALKKRVAALQKGDWQTANKYDAISQGCLMLLTGASDSPALFLQSTSSLVKPYFDLCRGVSGSPKLSLLLELLEDLTPQAKVIVFTCFERMARMIHQAAAKHRPALYTGQNLQEREDELARFRTDPDCRVLVSTDAGGVGLNLQVAWYLVNYDLPWSPGQLEQRYGRIKRFGSAADTVFAINLLTRGMVDEQILAAIERKEDIFHAVIQSVAC